MFSENLKKYRKLKGLTQVKLADLLSDKLGKIYTDKNVQSWENKTNPKLEIITALSDILDIAEQYLINSDTDKINSIVNNEIPNFKNVIEHTKKITLLDGYVGAGSSGIIEKIEAIDYLYVDNFMIKKGYQSKDIKGLTVVGDSMYPYVNCCDIVLFSSLKDGQYSLSDGKYIITTISGTMVKNLSFRANGDIIISSCNKAYSEEIIKASESQEILDIIGIVVGRVLKS